MVNYQFAAGSKEAMFDAIGSRPTQDTGVEKSIPIDQPRPIQEQPQITLPMTLDDWESEFGSAEAYYKPDEEPVRELPPVEEKIIDNAEQELQTDNARPELDQIKADEGFDNKVYMDSLNNLTVGVGHRLVGDELEKYKEGDEFSEEDINALLERDYETARSDAEKFAPDASPKALDIITNMSFQLGSPRLNTFKKFKAAVKAKDYETAADEMLDSLWASDKQTPERATRLADRMRALAETENSL